jgi:signal transduction histidine kinase
LNHRQGKSAGGDKLVSLPNKQVATHLYRIVQEAVHNAIKHASAKRIDIECHANKHELVLEIRDDGVGMPAKPPHNEGMGLPSMHQRAEIIGAALSIHNAPEGGVVVSCRLEQKAGGAGDGVAP